MKYLRLILDALLRSKTRTALSLLSIAAAFTLFGLLDVVRVAFEGSNNIEGANRLIVASRLSMMQPLPHHLLWQIEKVPGVARVGYAQMLPAYYREPRNALASVAVDREFFTTFPEYGVDAAQLRAFQEDRIGAIVGEDLARRFGWKIGDSVPLLADAFPSGGGNRWSFTVRGTYRMQDEQRRAEENQLMFHWEYFNEANDYLRDQVSWFIVTLSSVSQATPVAQAIDALFANSDHETRAQSEHAFGQSLIKQFADVGLITTAIVSAVFFTLILLTGNTMMQALRERTPELAVLKTIGFSDRAVLGMVLIESVLLLTAGGMLGLALAELLVDGIAAASGGVIRVADVPGSTWLIGAGLMLVIGVAVGLPPALRANRLKIIDALAAH